MSEKPWLTGPFVVVLVMSLVCISAYSLFTTHFTSSTFSPLQRISSLGELLDVHSIMKKLWYMFCVLAPTCAYFSRSRQGMMLALGGAPFWGASLISNFSEMWKPFNYYAVLPALLFHFGALVAYARRGMHTKPLPLVTLAFLVLLAFSLGYEVRPLREVRNAVANPVAAPYSLSFIKPGQRVVTSEFDALYVPRDAIAVRLWTANRLPTEYHSVLIRKPSKGEDVSAGLLKNTTVCYEDSRWILRCRAPF